MVVSTVVRSCNGPRSIAVVAGLATLLAFAATAAGQASRGEIDACVRDKLIKYASPDRAVIDQYLSIEAACEAALNGEPGARISVTPLEGGGSPGGGCQDDGPAAGRGATAPAVAAVSYTPLTPPTIHPRLISVRA